MNKPQHLKDRTNGEEMLREAVYSLKDLALAASIMGNDRLSKNLREIAEDVDTGKILMEKAYSSLLNSSVKSAQQSSETLLATALAMTKEKDNG